MSYRQWSAQNRRRDRAEPAILEALRAVGAEVYQVGGRGLPDILVRYRGILHAFEIKTGTKKRTQAQEKTQWPIVHDGHEALLKIGAIV